MAGPPVSWLGGGHGRTVWAFGWPQLDDALVGHGAVARPPQGIQPVRRQPVAGIGGQRLGVKPPRGVGIVLSLGDLAQAVIGIFGLVVARRQRGQIVPLGGVQASQPAQDIGAVVERRSRTRRNLQRGVIIRQRVRQPAQCVQRQAAREEGKGLVAPRQGMNFDRLGEIRQRSVMGARCSCARPRSSSRRLRCRPGEAFVRQGGGGKLLRLGELAVGQRRSDLRQHRFGLRRRAWRATPPAAGSLPHQ